MNEQDLRLLVFRIGPDSYSSPLLSVREVLEYQKPKFMPNMASHFAGIINVRGAIVGVIDLRLKLGYAPEIGPKTAMLLCDSERGPLAAIVDHVESVITVAETNYEKKPPIESKTDSRYLLGVVKSDRAELVTVIDLHRLIAEDGLKAA